MPTCPFEYPKQFVLLHPFPITPKSVYGPVREAIERRKALDDRLSHFRQVFIESTSKPREDFYQYYLGEIWDVAKIHELMKNTRFVYDPFWDPEIYKNTGFPDFLPGSGK